MVVFIAEMLEERHPDLVHELSSALSRHGHECRQVKGAADIWVRDFLPIQRQDGTFVSYCYSPDYLRNGYKHLISDWSKLQGLPKAWSVTDCGLILDGGNIVLHGRSAIVTSKLFAENSTHATATIERRLRDAFQLDRLIVIPAEPGDMIGHADGMVSWIDEHRVLLNDYRQIDLRLHRQVCTRLKAAGIDATELAYAPIRSTKYIALATGVYTNLLALPNVVAVPAYGIAFDDLAFRTIAEAFPGHAIIPLDCVKLALLGGSVHCVTAKMNLEPLSH